MNVRKLAMIDVGDSVTHARSAFGSVIEVLLDNCGITLAGVESVHDEVMEMESDQAAALFEDALELYKMRSRIIELVKDRTDLIKLITSNFSPDEVTITAINQDGVMSATGGMGVVYDVLEGTVGE
jgi:hypothetical protein